MMMPTSFEVETRSVDSRFSVITIRGELDMHTAPQLEESLNAVTASSEAAILIDLSDCEFIDSTGVALIVHAWKRVDRGAGEGKGRVVLCCPNHQVRRLLDITGVEESISMHDSVEEALAELRASASA